MRVTDLTARRQPLAVEIEASVACEFLTSLYVFCAEDMHDTLGVGKEWIDAIRATASPDLLEDIQRFSAGLGKIWLGLWPVVLESAASDDIVSVLSHLRSFDALDLRVLMLGDGCPFGSERLTHAAVLRAAQGDAAALEMCLTAAHTDCCEELLAALRYHLPLDLEEDKRALLSILRRWYDQIFQPQEAGLSAILQRDAAAKRRLATQHPAERFIELATNGLRYTPEPGITRVLLIPSVVHRPWALISAHRDLKILCYAVAEESLAETSHPSPAHLIALYKALADERRLHALQRLAVRTYTLQEMADELGIGKSLMHHHMITLRAAGLVRVSITGEKRYELRTETLSAMPDLLGAFLGCRPAEELAATR